MFITDYILPIWTSWGSHVKGDQKFIGRHEATGCDQMAKWTHEYGLVVPMVVVVVFFWAKYWVGCDSDKNETSDVQRNGPTENAENDLWFIYILQI